MSLEDRIYQSSPAWLRTVLMNLHAKRIERHRYGAPYKAAVHRLDAMARGSRAELDAYKDEQFRRVISIAYERSSFYREHWRAANVHPRDLRGLSDIEALPLVTKDQLKTAGAAARTAADTPRDWLVGRTSGTTGSPLTIWYDQGTCILNNAADRLQKVWAGVSDADWIGLFLGRVVTPTGNTSPPFWHPNYVLRQVWFSAFHLNPTNLDLYIAEIRRRKLKYLEGYPSTLYTLARHLNSRGERLPLQAVFSSSETMHDVQRQAVTEAFGAEIFDYFGHAERAVFAIECGQHEGKHIVEPYGHVEVLAPDDRPAASGQRGRIVATSLHNTAMPMIRYVTSDVSSIISERCECGRSFIRLENVSTKAEDIVVLEDGRWVSPSVLTHPFKALSSIVKSQVIQESLNAITVLVVVGPGYSQEVAAQLVAGLVDRLGPTVEVTVRVVDDIPREKSGKYRWVISKVSHAGKFSWSG